MVCYIPFDHNDFKHGEDNHQISGVLLSADELRDP